MALTALPTSSATPRFSAPRVKPNSEDFWRRLRDLPARVLGPGVDPQWRLQLDSPAWFYREEIEYELRRLGAQSWRFQDRPALFKLEESGVDGDVELSS